MIKKKGGGEGKSAVEEEKWFICRKNDEHELDD